MQSSIKSKLQSYTLWLTVAVCLGLLPAFLVFLSASQYFYLSEEELVQDLKLSAKKKASKLEKKINQEHYYSQLFHRKFLEARKKRKDWKYLSDWLTDQRTALNNGIDFICWDAKGKIRYKTFESKYSDKEWLEVFIALKQSKNANLEIARKVLGQQFHTEFLRDNHDPNIYALCRPDLNLEKPLFWTDYLSDTKFLILIPNSFLEKELELITSASKFAQNKSSFSGIFLPKTNQIKSKLKPNLDSKNLTSILKLCENEYLNFYETDQYLFFFHFLSAKHRFFAAIPKPLDKQEKFFWASLYALLTLIILSPFFWYTFQTIIRKKPGFISIRFRLAFIFFIANGIPLLGMGLISQEHYLHKKQTLTKDKQIWLTEVLKSFDNRFIGLTNKYRLSIKKQLSDWAKNRTQTDDETERLKSLDQIIKKHKPSSYFVISSNTPIILTSSHRIYYSGSLENPKLDKERTTYKGKSAHVYDDASTSNLIFKKILADLNGDELPASIISKMEIVIESLMQKTFAEINYLVLSNINKISCWGFGNFRDLTLFNFISFPWSKKLQYASLVFWGPVSIQRQYLHKALADANRNPEGIKIFAKQKSRNRYLPKNADLSPELINFFNQITERPTEEIEIIKYNNEDYLAVGFIGVQNFEHKLLALFPIKRIDQATASNKLDLILSILFTLILSFSLAQLLSKSFLKPLEALRKGALAIENRNFQHRIKGTAKDEFGNIAQIFNTTMVDFEELEVAKIVQENLFPQEAKSFGNYNVYGKSVTMGEIGGDYFDYFAGEDNEFSLLLGDVAGHGVGAALIMAMAKAGVIQSATVQNQPAQVLNNLHQLIRKSKTKSQKKIMTFQYLFGNSETGELIYSNAGGCSPMLVNKEQNSVKELSLTGPALGAFKKSKFTDISFKLKEGEAIVFYTDGIIETRNPDNQELGYDNFQNLLLETWHEEPKVYYQNIFNAYQAHLNNAKVQDDVTLMILTNKKS